MSDLSAAAEAMGVPEPIIERSARARAAASGQSYEDVITAWAGGEASAAPSAPQPEPEEAPPAEAAPEEATSEAAAPPEPAAQPAAAEPAQQPAAAAATAAPTPERVSPEEALEYPVVVTVPTAGITERTGFSIPMWLGALLLIVPAFGLIYLALGSGATECGSGTALRADRVTGVLENCDGTPFEGRGPAGGGGADFIAVGEEIFTDCAGCHGPQGEGGVGPALGSVLNTFSACEDHIQWVELGSSGFQAEGRSTYGDTAKPVTQGMPPFGGSLSPEQLASVVAFERVRFGGANQEETLIDCGLVEGQGGEDGTQETTDTTAPTEAGLSRRSG